MKLNLLKVSILLALGITGLDASATGLVAIPATGFTVPANTGTIGTSTGGSDSNPSPIASSYTSAYTLCNQTGNFGSAAAGSTSPTSSANNTCAVFPAGWTTAPVSGYTLVANTTTPIVLNDSVHTGGTNITVGTLYDYVWRNTAGNSCIYGARYQMANVIYNPAQPVASQGTFEIDDLARGGFAALNGTSAVNAGYYFNPATNNGSLEVDFRVGRAYTAVQHRADPLATNTWNNPALGYVNLPNITPAPPSGTAINGQATAWAAGMSGATASQQTADVRPNWVDFTTDVNYADVGCSVGGKCGKANSSMFYVQATCTTAAPTQVAGVIRVRQTGQETSELVEIALPGYAPAGGTAAY
jgi:hypothetical protein